MNTKEPIERTYDQRIVEFRLRRNEMDRGAYEEYLKTLPDDEGKFNYVDVYEEPPAEELTPHAEVLTFTSA